jgi:hypothetical protein
VDIVGSKAAVFHEDFTNHRATLLKADGKEILSVKVILNNGEKES